MRDGGAGFPSAMFFDEDRIVREVRRLAEIVARAVGLRTREADEAAESALGELHRAIFGLDRDTTARLDPSSLAAMVAPQHRAAALEVLEAEVRWLDARGRSADAAVRRAQAAAVRAEA